MGDDQKAPAEESGGYPESVLEAAPIFHCLGEPSRLQILLHLELGEHRVVDITEHLGLSQSTVSKHLAILRQAGLVRVRPEGRSSQYSLADPEGLRDVINSAVHMATKPLG